MLKINAEAAIKMNRIVIKVHHISVILRIFSLFFFDSAIKMSYDREVKTQLRLVGLFPTQGQGVRCTCNIAVSRVSHKS